MEHPRDSAFEAFVIGAMEADESAAFVAHTSTCDDCAKKLETEARTEVAMFEVHAASKAALSAKSTPVRSIAARPDRRPAYAAYAAIAGGLALAAALVFVVRDRPEQGTSPTTVTMTVTAPPAAQAPIPLVVCPDGLEQEKCVEDAHRHGLFVSYPPWASAPSLGGGRSGQGPSGSPFSGPQQM